MTSDSSRIVTPGEVIGDAQQYCPGKGVYERSGQLIATLVGTLRTERAPRPPKPHSDAEKDNDNSNKPILSVHRPGPADGMITIPNIGSLVRVRVLRVTPRAAYGEILIVDEKSTKESFKVMIRQQDIRQTEIDKIELYKCFMPGDIVYGEIISLGDKSYYYLSTAKNEYGVVYAKNKSTNLPMIAINWQQMQCPVTKMKEFRKVAKLF